MCKSFPAWKDRDGQIVFWFNVAAVVLWLVYIICTPLVLFLGSSCSDDLWSCRNTDSGKLHLRRGERHLQLRPGTPRYSLFGGPDMLTLRH